MKKNFFLKKTINELSEKQLKDLDAIFGGRPPIPVYLPTRAFRCIEGMHWNDTLGRCVPNVLVEEESNSDIVRVN